MIKKLIFPVLVFGALYSCTPKDEPTISQQDIEQHIVAKWKLYKMDGKLIPTNSRTVYTFAADKTGTQTMSSLANPITGTAVWYVKKNITYSLSKNTINTFWNQSSTELEWLATISAISTDSMCTKPSRLFENTSPKANVPACVWHRVSSDYCEDIIGLWEGVRSSNGTYGDENHRWLFDPNGTYTYFDKTGNDWIESANTMNEYAVDGDFLAFRWKKDSISNEDREWWDITIQGDSMYWIGLREDSLGKLYQSSFTLRRVSPTKAECQQYLLGKWITDERDGLSILTNEKSVHTFLNNGQVEYTIANAGEAGSSWYNRLSLSYSLYGNYLVESGQDNHGKTIEPYRSHFNEINDTTMEVISITGKRLGNIRLHRVNNDFSTDILGTWEGVSSSNSITGDENHRWKYYADGHYDYLNKEEMSWVPAADNNGEYLVDGNWMACRWNNGSGGLDYEWWDITIEGDTMRWNALRQDPQGARYNSYFVLKRIAEEE